jgi:multidrug efflux pump subunit AcrA (membrane-fusion protein)
MRKFGIYILSLVMLASCHNKKAGDEPEGSIEVVTPVTITAADTEPMAEYIELNATSAFLQKAYVKASTSGYIKAVNIQIGNIVSAGQHVFTLQTKEAQSIGNTINLLDTSFRFSGLINIKAGTGGYISELNHQPGDYVQEGEQLAVISDMRSFVFILNLPYELRPYVMNRESVELVLPDGRSLLAHVASVMPVVDSVSQTQNIVLRVADKDLPANLIAKVKLEKTAKENAVSLPRAAILSDETQTLFWVMKVTDSTRAVKVPVKKGIETRERIEIISPVFSKEDRFLLTGNYGLPDTARIKIIQQ